MISLSFLHSNSNYDQKLNFFFEFYLTFSYTSFFMDDPIDNTPPCSFPASPNPDFNFDEPDFDSFIDSQEDFLYVFPSGPSQVDISSEPSSEFTLNPPNVFRFNSVHSFRQFMNTTTLNLHEYCIVLPATKFRSIRFDRRPSHSNQFELLLVHNNSS